MRMTSLPLRDFIREAKSVSGMVTYLLFFLSSLFPDDSLAAVRVLITRASASEMFS